MSTKRRRKVEYGTVDIPDEAFAPENVRVRISIMIPGDVLDAVRKMAAADGIKYQTLINKLLRDAVSAGSLADRVGRLERKVFEQPARKAG